jgi:hypothetical protein
LRPEQLDAPEPARVAQLARWPEQPAITSTANANRVLTHERTARRYFAS